jgi:hypothetical protein
MIYAIGLTILNGFHKQDLIVGVVLLFVYALTMRTIWPGIEIEMQVPVLICGLVLLLTLFLPSLATAFRWCGFVS